MRNLFEAAKLLLLDMASTFSVVTWSAFMLIYAIVSKALLFVIGYATMRTIGVHRRRSRTATAPS
jgi:hypothetical protein